jgi:hypothetical protein
VACAARDVAEALDVCLGGVAAGLDVAFEEVDRG